MVVNRKLIRTIKADIYYTLGNKINIFIFLILMVLYFYCSWITNNHSFIETGDRYLYSPGGSSDIRIMSVLIMIIMLGITSNKMNKSGMITYQHFIIGKKGPLLGYIISNLIKTLLFFLPEILVFFYLCMKNGISDSCSSYTALMVSIIVMFDYFRLAILFSLFAFIEKSEVKGMIYEVLFSIIQFFALFALMGIDSTGIINNKKLVLLLANCPAFMNITMTLEYVAYSGKIVGVEFALVSALFGLCVDVIILIIINLIKQTSAKKNIKGNGNSKK